MLRPSYFITVFFALIIFGAGMPVSLPDIGLVPDQQYVRLSASVSASGDSVYADQPAATLLDDVSQMFNERGYLKSNGISLDEQEIVSDYGGNLMYSIPLDNPYNGNQFESSDQQDYLAVNVYDTVTIENSIIDVFTPPNGYYDLPNYTKGRLAATAFRTRQTDIWSYKYYRYDERGKEKLGNSQGMRMTSESNLNSVSSYFKDTISKTIHPITYFDPSNLVLNENSQLFTGYMIFEVAKNKLYKKDIDSLFFICNIFWIKEICELKEISSRFLLTTPTLMYQIYIDKLWDEDKSNVTLAEFRSFYQDYKESVNNDSNDIPFLRNSLKTSIFRESTYFCSNSLSDSVGYFVFNVSFEAARLTMDLKYRNPLDSSELLNYFDANVLIPISPEFYFFPTNKIFLTECELREATWFPDNLFLD